MNKYSIVSIFLYLTFNITYSFSIPIPNPIYDTHTIQVGPLNHIVNNDIKDDQIFHLVLENVFNDLTEKENETKQSPESSFFLDAYKLLNKNTQTIQPTTIFIAFEDQKSVSNENKYTNKLFTFFANLWNQKIVLKK